MKQLSKAIFFFALFFLFSVIVAFGFLKSFDLNLTIALQNNLTRSVDTALSFFSLFGSFEFTTFLLLVGFVWLKMGRGLITITLFGLGMVIELLGKVFLVHPGPPSIFFRYSLPVFFPSVYVQTGHSYPSGHSFRAVFLTIILVYLINSTKILPQNKRRLAALACYLLLAVMLISRITLGEHWTTDVIGGSLLGAAFALLSVHLYQTRLVHLLSLKNLRSILEK